ncbi:MAG: folylpolyglutamate synthase/dihydrofolate synthase family protein [Prosthecochloris sp.]|nr:folylpolyglutamate synthase/dihydrofolate synthase family protein [Prosthecochloris sp.]
MNYQQALDFLFPLNRFGMKPGLERIGRLLDSLDNPHRHECLVVHVAGTNGKGTVAAAVASVFMQAGKRVGLYTSPHLVSFTERIRVDGRQIPEDAVASVVSGLKPHVEEIGATFFETTTAMAFEYFRREQVEVMVLETGMGGRLDATNVVDPAYVIIPSISLDHTRWLGESVAEIAVEKAGVIKEGARVFTAVDDPQALPVLQERARRVGASLHHMNDEMKASVERESLGELVFDLETMCRFYEGLRAPVTGAFHVSNIALAAAVAEHAGVSAEDIRHGLAAMRSTGYRARLEVVTGDPCTVLLDVSHNPAGIEKSVDVLCSLLDGSRHRSVLLGLADDKDATQVVRLLKRFSDRFLVVDLPVERGMPADRLAAICRANGVEAEVCATAADALAVIRREASNDDIVLVTGSFYLAGDILKTLDGG